MKPIRNAAVLAGMGALVTGLAACSTDTLIWGADGARVIETTEQFVQAVASGDGDTFVCADTEVDLGEPEDWAGLSAGEPEKFTAEYWPEQVPLQPAWSINLELGIDGATPNRIFPGDVFYREADAGVCVVDIVWWTVEADG